MPSSARFNRLLLLLLLPATSVGQVSSPTAAAKSPAAHNYSQEAIVFEQFSAKLVFESDGTFTREDYGKIRIQSDAGVQRYGVLTFPYAKSEQSLNIDFVRVHKPDGSVVLTPAENVQDMASDITREAPFYSDLREKHIAVRGLGVGDVLEFRTQLHDIKPLAPGKFWFSYTFSDNAIFLDEELEISVPLKSAIKLATPTVKPAVTETEKYRVYRWIHSNLEQKPKPDQQLANYQQARGRLPAADVQISNFQSWAEVGRWYNDLQQERVKPTAEIQAKAAELTKNAPDETAKLNVIYKYVGTDIHYIGIAFGIGRYQPHSAGEVLDNQYGDCKDKHTLLASLLAAAGIPAYPALISASREVDPEVPSPGQFDHVITVVPRGKGNDKDKDLLWLDSTPEVAPFAYLITPLRDKRALVIYADKAAELQTTPADPVAKSFSSFDIKAKLSDAGVLEGQIENTKSGDDVEVLLRSAFRRLPIPQWKDLIQQISYASGFAGDVSDVTASSPDALDEPFHFGYKYLRKDYPDWENRKISPPLPPIMLPALGDDDTKLTSPVWLGVPGEHTFTSEVELPKGYHPQLPKDVDLVEDFAEYHASSTSKDGELTTKRRLVIKRHEVPVSAYEEYKKFSKAVTDDHDVYISLLTGKEAAGVAPYQDEIWQLPYSTKPEAARAYDDAREEFNRNDRAAEIASLNHVVTIDPKFTRAWLWLGEIYKSGGEQDLALQAYRKAVEIDPGVPVSYKALGTLLTAMSKLDEAVPVWQKLTSIAPQDPYGAVNLGFTYVLLKNYKDAAPVFEAAAKLQPDWAFLKMDLGICYLHMGADDKAFDYFKVATTLDPSARTLNGVAYELADANKELPEALQYAKKAVHDQETESNKIDLDALKVEDLGTTWALPAYWDTLGWVYFRLKNYDQAERYTEASWRLLLGGLEADHLGQIYEAQHRKGDAIRMYRIAIAFGSPKYLPLDIPKIKERLARLGGSSGPTVAANDEANKMRSFLLPRLVEGEANAEFFLLFSPQEKSPGFAIKGVRFIKGSDKLKSAGKMLSSINYRVRFPDNDPAHIIRRGIVGCYKYTGCSIVLFTPDNVNSIN